VRQLGEQVGASLTAWPELVEEIAGIAAGAGQDERELLAINARTELLGAASRPECSFVGLLPRATAAGTTVLAQNWDWHPDLAESVVVWSIRTPDGHALTTMTEAGILARLGRADARRAADADRLRTALHASAPRRLRPRRAAQRRASTRTSRARELPAALSASARVATVMR
jgi:isopenicillin-N N-acyltransferase like protein